MSEKIIEVFGQFAVELENGVKLFDNISDAQAELSRFENGAEQVRVATQYAEARGLEGKNAKGKINVVVDFLRWVDAGQPMPVAEEVEAVVELVGADKPENDNDEDDFGGEEIDF